jgi:iron complex outermembrane receptor protein
MPGFSRAALLGSASALMVGLGCAANAAAETPNASVLEEVIVTAQKRSENLQDVPASVTAFSATSIEKYRLTDIRAVADRTPNFTVGQQGPASPTLTIRGIGSSDREAGSDRSVVLFIDEVYIGRAGASTFDLFDAAQIEVLRGPQGSLFGKNVVGGAVSITTADVKPDFDASLEFGAGNRALLETKGMVNLPFSDVLAGRFAFSAKKQDGYYFNRNFNQRAGDSRAVSGRAKLKFTPSENLDATLTLEGSQDNIDGLSHQSTFGKADPAVYRPGFIGLYAVGSLPDPNPYVVSSNAFGYLDRELYSAVGRVNWRQSYGTWTFIPAYRRGAYKVSDDVSAIRLVGVGPSIKGFRSQEITDETYTAKSAELRLASNGGGKLDWLFGVYYLSEHTDRTQIRDRLVNNTYSRPIFLQDNKTDSAAAFGALTWHPIDVIDLRIGARYTRDKKDFSITGADTITPAQRVELTALYGRAPGVAPLTALYTAAADETWSEFTPDASLTYRFTDDISAYGRIATGFKSGGFNGLAANAAQAVLPFNPETAVSYEVGLKTRFLENRAQINATAFLLDFKDLQLRDRVELIPGNPTSAIVTIINAAKARTKGVEIEGIVKPVSGLTLSGSVSRLSAKVTDTPPGSTILLGGRLPRSPKWTANLSAEYAWTLPDSGQITGQVEYRYVGNLYYDINEAPVTYQRAYNLVNARLEYAPHAANWTVAAWARNIGKEVYVTDTQAGTGGFYGVSQISEPRTYGVTLKLDY